MKGNVNQIIYQKLLEPVRILFSYYCCSQGSRAIPVPLSVMARFCTEKAVDERVREVTGTAVWDAVEEVMARAHGYSNTVFTMSTVSAWPMMVATTLAASNGIAWGFLNGQNQVDNNAGLNQSG